ncbi:TonB-dependent receptor domain-containing protein [Tenacibaculum sp. Ill]|uniref:TonB-dependent receptor domain-containing protein n=1 Tax=Tenacibaculum sp. Ill TaxID=3445935 RepID=UPI003F79FE3E
MKKNKLLTLLILFVSITVFSQITYKGTVINEENKPLSFVNIIVYDSSDKSLMKGVITDDNGEFDVKVEKNKPVYIEISFLGYKTIKKEFDNQQDVDFGEVALQPDSNTLDEVVITKKKELIEKHSDHFVVNLSNRSFVQNSNSWQTLKKAPLLSVKENKGLGILGKDDVVVYINSRKSNFSGDELTNYLKNLAADRISKVEIYTSPPARFDAQGNGVVNIILKANPQEGLVGSISNIFRQSRYAAFKTSVNLNYNKDKWNVYNSTWFSEGTSYVKEQSKQYFPNNINTSTHDTDRLLPSNTIVGTKLGIDYNLSDKHLLGFLFDVNYNKPSIENRTYSNYFTGNTLDSITTTTADGSQKKLNYNFNLNHLFKIDSLGSTLSWDVNYFKYENTQNTKNNNFLNNSSEPSLLSVDNFRSDVTQYIDNINVKADYYKVLNDEWNLSLGGQYYETNTENEIILRRYNSGVYEIDPDVSNLFNFEEKVTSGYISIKYNPSQIWNYSLGLRVEGTYQKGNQKTTKSINTNKYKNVFPSAYVKYAPNRKHVLSVSLNNRIVRPGFWQLNPFRNYVTPQIYSEGNPFLNPSRTFTTELSYVLNSKHTFIFNYSKERDVIGQLSRVLPDNVLNYYRDNYGVYERFGGTYLYNFSTKNSRFESQFTANASYKKLIAIPSFNEAFTRDGLELDLRSYNYYYFLKDKSLEACIDFYYNRYGPLTQSTLSPVFSTDFSLSKRFNNWYLSLFIQDILKTDKYKFNLSENTGYRRTNENYYDARRIVFSMRYNFGRKTVKKKRNRRTNSSIRNRVN